jgi:hypothetical protein
MNSRGAAGKAQHAPPKEVLQMKYVMVLSAAVVLTSAGARCALAADGPPASVEEWDIYDLPLRPAAMPAGNPFTDVQLSATFTHEGVSVETAGFYDGDNTFRVRFMPTALGEWQYTTHSSIADLNNKTGQVTATKPSAGNHGPVQVAHTFHFAYADQTPYFPFGTTCYAWTHQGDKLEEQTLATLKAGPFNKIRMCVFPKHYDWNHNEPVYYPFEGTPPKTWDFTRFNPAFFQHLEKRIGQLRDMNIEADLILFHPYDKGTWGFDSMGAENDDRYLKYVLARLSCYRNIWWSLANEYDFSTAKKLSDWDRFFHIVEAGDPYHHLRSIHNGGRIYNYTQPWVTHASIQNGEAVEDVGRAWLYRQTYGKAVVMDEVKYEGNISSRWGQLSGEEMTYRFWNGIISGVYVTHGETLAFPPPLPTSDVTLWWSKGGELRGQSPARIGFLRKIVEAGPKAGVNPIDMWEDVHLAGQPGQYYLRYFGKEAPKEWTLELPRPGMREGMKFKVDVIDTWDMTITPDPRTFTMVVSPKSMYRYRDKENATIALPGKPYMALRITNVP